MFTDSLTTEEEGVEFDEEPFKERTLGSYLEARTKQERKPFEPFDVAVQMIRDGKFRRMLDLALYFGKSAAWATDFKTLAVRQGVFTIEEWRACFQRGHSLGRSISDPRTWEEQQAKEQQPTVEPAIEEEPYLTSRDGYMESYAVILERVRAGEFCNEKAMGRFYHCRPHVIDTVRTSLISAGLVTEEQWSGYMRRRTWKRRVVNQSIRTTTTADGRRIERR